MKVFSLLFLLFTATAQASQQPLSATDAKIEWSKGPYWVQSWSLLKPTGVALKDVTSFDQNLLMTFSGADFTYLNQAQATQHSQTGTDASGQATWTFSDDKVQMDRSVTWDHGIATVNVKVQFKSNAPEKAFLNMVTLSPEKDEEERHREIQYYSNDKIHRETVSSSIDPTEIIQPVKWIAASSRYFIFAVLPNTQPEKTLYQTTASRTAQISLQYPVQNQALNLQFKVVMAPKQLDVLRAIEPTLDHTVNLGFFTFLAYPILWMLKWIHSFVQNYGVAIIILTILIKILTFPLVLKSVKGARKMADFQPKMKALQEKYKNDKESLNREMMILMKSSGYNPLSGCMPLLLQMPIFFALYSVLDTAYELYRAPFAGWLIDLSAKDPYYITPVLMTLIMFAQQKLTPPAPGMDETQRKVLAFMPLMFGAFMLMTPSGLCVYMLVNSVVSIAQQMYLNKKIGVPGHVSGIATGM